MRSSVLVTDSAVFAGTTNRVLLAYSSRNGRRHWYQRFEGEIASDVVRSGRTLFFTTAEMNGKVHARDMERGKKVWDRSIGPTRFSPLLDQGLLYVGTDRGLVHALRSESGDELWRVRVSGALAGTLLGHGDALIALTATDTIYRLARRDGAILAHKGINTSVTAAPALQGDTIILATHSGAVIGVDANTLEPLWRVETGEPILAAPVVAHDGVIHVMTRAAAIWRISGGKGTQVTKLAGSVTTSFTLARDRYIVGMVDGTLTTTTLDGRVVSQHRFNDSVVAPVVVQGGALYVPLLRGRIVKMR
jgi:outer membrane protein assembly factor BamB